MPYHLEFKWVWFLLENKQNMWGNDYKNRKLFFLYIISSCGIADGCKYSKFWVTSLMMRSIFFYVICVFSECIME